MSQLINNLIKFLPHQPGVYQFLNKQGEVIYVGKAKDLKKRVSSYFNRNRYESAKLRVLVSKVTNIKHIIVETESDALLLENNLIKKLKPRYNILLKDDKTYPWICIKNETFPRVFSTRRVSHDGSRYFGPYTSVVLMKTILELINSLYPLRTCNLSLTYDNIEKQRFKPCLEYQIGNCLAPCVGYQSEEDYNKNIESIVQILSGNIQSVKRILIQEMKNQAKLYEFETANIYKQKIEALERYQAKSTIVNPRLNNLDVFTIVKEKNFACVNFIKVVKGSVVQSHNLELKQKLNETSSDLLSFAIAEIRQRLASNSKEIVVPFKPEFTIANCKYIVPTRGDKHKLLQLSQRNAKAYVFEKLAKQESAKSTGHTQRILEQLRRDFKTHTLPTHIECFDNSNLQGTNPVSACIVFRNAKPSKRDYRIFNIKTVEGPNDYATMVEVLRRRYKRLLSSNQSLPQLIIIDGGKGQLSVAYSVLQELGIHRKVSIIGIAERLEEIFFPGDPVPLFLDKNSESLKVIQNARNEAHRFSITHHRNLRSKQALKSQLTDIKGIGEKSREILFQKYKSYDSISRLSLNEFVEILGEKRGKLIFDYFNSKP
ncbi:MAG: excinuclease ABC subunit UvrC [Bacteroidales bacterium]|nr:excinuclease ABC subunit UvrC [Bacteroidales bacterium]MDD4671980.1 excinuclease ABC subunit UvrC [Bacteroidales bacterium]MDY0347198.1 excinuclease ABC subunit UvrC [Tenuifilaceae bacterium]